MRTDPPCGPAAGCRQILRLVLRPLATGQQRPAARTRAALGSSAKVRAKLKAGSKIALNQPERAEFEPSESVEFTTIHDDSRTNDLTRTDVSAREMVAFGPMKTGDFGGVEDSLARAITQASVVGRWDIVAQLARELEARRLSALRACARR